MVNVKSHRYLQIIIKPVRVCCLKSTIIYPCFFPARYLLYFSLDRRLNRKSRRLQDNFFPLFIPDRQEKEAAVVIRQSLKETVPVCLLVIPRKKPEEASKTNEIFSPATERLFFFSLLFIVFNILFQHTPLRFFDCTHPPRAGGCSGKQPEQGPVLPAPQRSPPPEPT